MEQIRSKDGVLACVIIPASYQPDKTRFLTPPELAQQVGFVVYPQGGEIKRHIHKNNDRVINGASECLFIREGRCEIDIYGPAQELIATRALGPGDFVLMLAGGHGFRVLEKCTFLEVKLGPYLGVEDKELF